MPRNDYLHYFIRVAQTSHPQESQINHFDSFGVKFLSKRIMEMDPGPMIYTNINTLFNLYILMD